LLRAVPLDAVDRHRLTAAREPRLGSNDRRLGDGAGLHSPLVEDLGVDAVVDEHLDRGKSRYVELRGLREGEAVRGYPERRSIQLELTLSLLDDVARDLGVGEADLGAAARDGEVGLVLGRERQHRVRLPAGLLAQA